MIYTKFFILFLLITCAGLSANSKIKLSEKEEEFINKHPVIVLGTEKEWEPFVIVQKNGKISGYDFDILHLVNSLTGANFILLPGKWEDMLKKAKHHLIDGLSTGVAHKERKKYLKFSDTYISLEKMLILQKGNPFNILSSKDLIGKVISIHKGNLLDEKLAKKFPRSTILKTKSLHEQLEAVASGKADASFGNGSTMYMAGKLGIVALQYGFSLNQKLDLSFGVRKDWPEAISILDKGLRNISKSKKIFIQNKWFQQSVKVVFDYNLFWKILIIILIIVTLIGIHSYILRKINKKLKVKQEQLLEKNKIIHEQNNNKRTLIHVLCHDLVNPIGAIHSALKFLELENEFSEETKTILSIIQRSTNNSLKIIELIRQNMALDEDQLLVPLENVKLSTAINTSIEMLETKFNKKNIKIKLEFDNNILVKIEPVSFINSVVNNLLTNALKFSEKGSEVIIKGKNVNDKYLLSFQDFGMGIPKNLLQNLFNPAERTNRLGTLGEAGTGFGMPLVKKFVESYDGKIDIISNIETRGKNKKGTIVTLELVKAILDKSSNFKLN